MADPDRKGGGGLSLRTLAIASAASLVAAMVTSRLFPPGTIYTAALTPVLVAAVSEVLSRPVDRVAQIRRRGTVAMDPAHVLTFTPDAAEKADLDAPPPSFEGPVRIHGRRRRILHPKVWIVTGLAAFAIAAAALTLPELIFGGAVATSHQTTLFGGGRRSTGTTKTETTTTPTQSQTVTQTVTQTTPTTTQQTQTTLSQTTPTTTGTSTQTTPQSTTPTGTSTSPAPSGNAVP